MPENGSMSDEWFSPQWIFESLNLSFDVDVASPGAEFSPCPAVKHYTIEDNGLAQKWSGLVWMNPPYSKPKPWVEKWIDHNNGVALLPFAKSSWFLTLWNSSAHLMPLPVNLKFDTPEGLKKPIMTQTFLAALGEQSVQALKNLDVARIRK